MTRRMTRRPASDYRAAMTQPLGPSTVHLWYTQSDDLTAPAALDAYLGLLSPDERTRHARFLNERARHEYLITRALCRTVLSRYAAVAPADWRFRANQWGRPEIDCPSPDYADLRFNLSNTRGLVVCAVAQGGEIGVDVELIDRAGSLLEIADRFMAPVEARDIAALPPDAQALRFFTYWTLKEAYIKARGMGLSIPLDKFWFLLDTALPRPAGAGPRYGRHGGGLDLRPTPADRPAPAGDSPAKPRRCSRRLRPRRAADRAAGLRLRRAQEI